jgi:hypothetical protein
VFEKYLKEYMMKDYIEEVEKVSKVLSPILVISKVTKGEWRVIVDLQYINSFQRVLRFKNEGVESLGGVLKKED